MTARGALDVVLRARLGDLTLDVTAVASPHRPLALLGRNGAGKTTVLRCIAGLHAADAGHVRLAGVTWFDSTTGVDVPPHRRRCGYVPQHSVLLPHLDVAGNVAYGPRAARLPGAERRRRVAAALERFDLSPLAHRPPATLSGGERQRVALARAVVLDPSVLLLDEPISALDAASRASVRGALRALCADRDGVTVVVTHDARDAFELAVDVAVLEAGTVAQSGPVVEAARRPRTAAVAALLGANWLRGVAAHGDGEVWTVVAGSARLTAVGDPDEPPVLGREAFVLVDPRDVVLHVRPPGGSARNAVHGRVVSVTPAGGTLRVVVQGDVAVAAEVTHDAVTDLGLREGVEAWAVFKATAARAFS